MLYKIQMLTMLHEFTVKEVDHRIVECDNICVRSSPNSEAHKEWTSYKDNMKATVEQYTPSAQMPLPTAATTTTTPMYQTMPPQQQMIQGQNIRPPQPPVAMQTGYPIRPPTTWSTGHPQRQQWTGLVEQAQIPTQQPMIQDMAQQHPEGQNELMAADRAVGNGQQQASNSDGSVTKGRSSFDCIVDHLSGVS
ncbi:uncharacterized protein [Dysidea avara]|uniref:uncharacterized protein isoform X3 n=1 Tax=Dysidea avara TaxID=196820 RepID=UPI003331BF22